MKIYSLDEAAQELGVSPKTIINLVWTNKLHPIPGAPRSTRDMQFSEDAIEARKKDVAEGRQRQVKTNRLFMPRDVSRPYRHS